MLFNYFKDNSKADIHEYSSYDEMLRKSKDSILIVDLEVYNYYRNTDLSLPKDMLSHIDSVAEMTGRTRNELLLTCIEFSLKHIEIIDEK